MSQQYGVHSTWSPSPALRYPDRQQARPAAFHTSLSIREPATDTQNKQLTQCYEYRRHEDPLPSIEPTQHAMVRPLQRKQDASQGEERLFPEYQSRQRPRKYFTVGKVFLTLWSEPLPNSDEHSLSSGMTTGRFGERVFSKIRRFVVIRSGDKHASCLPICTYGRLGVQRVGVKKDEHAIVYSGRKVPPPLPGEAPARGESGLLPEAIRVDLDTREDRLDTTSRINFGTIYTVEHNVKVRACGKVNPSSMGTLMICMRAVWAPTLSGPLPFEVRGSKPDHHDDANSKRSEGDEAAPLLDGEETLAEDTPTIFPQAQVSAVDDSSTMLESESRLGAMHLGRGQWNEAQKVEATIAEKSSKLFGEDHPNTLTAKENLAALHEMRQHWKEAESLRADILLVRSRSLGEKHPRTLAAMEDLAATHRQQRQLAKEEALRMKILAAQSAVLGEKHAWTLIAMDKLAGVYRMQGKWNEEQALRAVWRDAGRNLTEETAVTEGEASTSELPA